MLFLWSGIETVLEKARRTILLKSTGTWLSPDVLPEHYCTNECSHIDNEGDSSQQADEAREDPLLCLIHGEQGYEHEKYQDQHYQYSGRSAGYRSHVFFFPW